MGRDKRERAKGAKIRKDDKVAEREQGLGLCPARIWVPIRTPEKQISHCVRNDGGRVGRDKRERAKGAKSRKRR